MATRRTVIAIVVAIAVLGAACTGDAPDTTTIPPEIPDLEFGSGAVPFTVPGDFPFPDSAVIGTTMIDGVNGRSEMNVNFPAAIAEIVMYYETTLPALGFVITDSMGAENEWDIGHARDGVAGTIHLTFGGAGLSSGTFAFDHS